MVHCYNRFFTVQNSNTEGYRYKFNIIKNFSKNTLAITFKKKESSDKNQ